MHSKIDTSKLRYNISQAGHSLIDKTDKIVSSVFERKEEKEEETVIILDSEDKPQNSEATSELLGNVDQSNNSKSRNKNFLLWFQKKFFLFFLTFLFSTCLFLFFVHFHLLDKNYYK